MSVLNTLGFHEEDGKIPGRVVGTVWGGESTGKTHFCLSAPGPVAVFLLDIGGTEGVASKFGGKDVRCKWYDIPKMSVNEKSDFTAYDKAQGQRAARLWNSFYGDFVKVLDSEEVRTIVVDTVTDCYDLCRMSYFLPKLGKMDKIMSREYGPVKQGLRQLYTLAQGQTATNVLFVAKQKDVYLNDKRTNKVELHGPSDIIGYGSSLMLHTIHDSEGFGVEITKCRTDVNKEGLVLYDVGFPEIAALATDTDVEDWES
jgi:hypothetical protein